MTGATAGDSGGRRPQLRQIGLDGFVPYLINRIAARYNADMSEALRERGLTTAQMRALAVLSVHPGVTVNKLAVYAVMEQSTMSRTLDAMAEAGLVERRPRVADARVREVALTPAGAALFAEIWPVMQNAEARMLEGVAETERSALIATLGTMLRNIRKCPF